MPGGRSCGRSIFHAAAVRLVLGIDDFLAGEHGVERVGEQLVGGGHIRGSVVALESMAPL